MKLFKLFLKTKKNNKGYSLVEVIVAMLILSIITIPLLQSYATVLRVNLKNRKTQYANTVANNILEGLKEYGLAEVAVQMYGLSGDGTFKLADSTDYGECLVTADADGKISFDTTTVFTDVGTTSADGSVMASVRNIGGVKTFVSRIAKPESETGAAVYNSLYARKYYYFINGITEGTQEYDVHITYDATTSEFANNQINDYQLGDYTTLNSTKTALLSPSGYWYTTIEVGSGDDKHDEYDMSVSFESRAVAEFEDRYTKYLSESYAESNSEAELRTNLINAAIQAYISLLIESNDSNVLKRQVDSYLVTEGNESADGVTYEQSRAWRIAAYKYFRDNAKCASAYKEFTDQGVYFPSAGAEDEDEQLAQFLPPGSDYNDILKDLSDDERYLYFLSRLNRTTIITITYENNKYHVVGSVIFTLDQTDAENTDLKGLVINGSTPDLDAYNEAITYDPGTYYVMDFNYLENIYLFQDAGIKAAYESDTVVIDYTGLGTTPINTGNGSDHNVNVYMIWQYADTSKKDYQQPTGIDLVLAGNTALHDNFVFYAETEYSSFNRFYMQSWDDSVLYNDTFKVSGATDKVFNDATGSIADRYISKIADYDRAYTVTVEVYEHGDTSAPVSTVSATIKE